MRIFENPRYKFVEMQKKAFVVSSLLIVASIASLIVRGVTPGIDFLGGSEFIIATDTPLEVTDIRNQLTDQLGASPEVKHFGDTSTLLVRTTIGGDVNETEKTIVETISSRNPGSNPQILKTDSVGPRFADDLKRGAILSVLFALVVIFIYIMVRFEWRFGVGAVAALAHDVTITLGLFSLLHGLVPFSLQIDQAIIAAFLTIVGYSLNDTVVVFDRIREFTSIFKTEPYDVVINRSINSTLSRTIVTSGTTLIVVLVLFLTGGEVLRGFAFALIVGIFVGTYSSVFIAAPVVLELRKRTRK
ncbi:MAG: protein translocase subunit SecF [Rhodothermia bacterium]